MTAKPTIVFCPGLLNDGALWAAQTDALSETHDCVVFDTAQSDHMEDLGARLLAQAPERFSLAGLSMGGYVAMEVMRQAPERVERLALIDTSARADVPEQTENRKRMIDLAESGHFNDIPKALFPNLLSADSLHDDDIVATMMAMAERVGPKGFVRQQHAIMGRPDSRADLERFTCPTLVLCGEQDAITPPDIHREMAGLLPNAKLVTVPACGHMSPIEQPQAVTAVLRYWLQEG